MRNLLFLLPLAGLLWACDDFRTDDGETRLQWSFDKETELLTRSLSEIPDTFKHPVSNTWGSSGT